MALYKAIAFYRKYRKECWPVSENLVVEPHQRSQLIGPSGLHMKRIYLETGTTLTPSEDSNFTVFAPSQSALDEAKELIDGYMLKERVPELEFGGIYTAKITEIRDTGVMVVLYPSMPPALLHNSQLDQRKIAHPSALGLEVGQEIQVKYFGRDPVSGFMRLSRKVLQGPAVGIARSLNKAAAGENSS